MTDLVLIVEIAGERAAFRAGDVQSVVELESLTPVPRAPAYVAGVSALRSRPLTVIDAAAALGLEPGKAELGGRKAVIAEFDRFLYALLVDGIEDAVPATSELLPLPGKLSAQWQRVALGLAETAAGAVLVIDARQLLAGPDARCAA